MRYARTTAARAGRINALHEIVMAILSSGNHRKCRVSERLLLEFGGGRPNSSRTS